MPVMDLAFRPLTAQHWPALEDLFGRAGASNGCWCMYWRIGPRYHERPRDENKHDLRQLAASGPSPGLLAFDGGSPSDGVSLSRELTWAGWRTPGTCSR